VIQVIEEIRGTLDPAIIRGLTCDNAGQELVDAGGFFATKFLIFEIQIMNNFCDRA
jgi:hypothetical protein